MALPILVGVDGSTPSLAAADWAAAEASLTGTPVRLLFVYWVLPDGEPLPAGNDRLQAEAVQMLTRTAEELRARYPGLQVDHKLVTGNATTQLLHAADRGGTLVVGSRGTGGFAAMLLGSTALGIAARTEHPVVLVRADDSRRPQHEVVLGLEPGPDRSPVVEFALAQAERRGAPLRVLHAWMPPILWMAGPVPPGQAERTAVQNAVEQELRDLVLPLAAKHPDLEVRFDTHAGSAAHAIVDAANHAELLVLGRRRSRPVSALGPVTHAAIHYGHSPIAVVPHS
ncbi:universal stress protein [Streptacidiphilus sp. EB129]|uniref:universal stress protein n=1 Tax=Streptacidiphilus sp. EB129 TaxID=3156262 RepID=UPI00351641DA